MIITRGFNEEDRPELARLYWQAFGAKLGKVMGPAERGEAFVAQVAHPDYALCAYENDRLMGVAGYKTFDGAFVGGTIRDMARIYGWFGAIWRIALLALLERDVENKRFLMDGIFVTEDARGRGVGTALLNAIIQEGKDRGYREIRLDVIDTNTRARALYESHGFQATGTTSTGPLRHVFGFSSATTMVRKLT